MPFFFDSPCRLSAICRNQSPLSSDAFRKLTQRGQAEHASNPRLDPISSLLNLLSKLLRNREAR